MKKLSLLIISLFVFVFCYGQNNNILTQEQPYTCDFEKGCNWNIDTLGTFIENNDTTYDLLYMSPLLNMQAGNYITKAVCFNKYTGNYDTTYSSFPILQDTINYLYLTINVKSGRGICFIYIYSSDLNDSIDRIEYMVKEDKLLVNPNPVHDVLYLNEKVDEISVYDLRGHEIKTVYHTSEIDVRDLERGFYVLLVKGYSCKFLKL